MNAGPDEAAGDGAPAVIPGHCHFPPSKSCANPEQDVDTPSARSHPAAARCKQFAVHSLPI